MGRGRVTFARASIYGFVALSVVSWVYILAGGDSGLDGLFSGRAWSNAGNFVRQLMGLDAGLDGGGRPAFLELHRWMETGQLAFAARNPSLQDWMLNVAGGTLGAWWAHRRLSRRAEV